HLTCAEGTSIDASTKRLSLFHILERLETSTFPTALQRFMFVAMFAREANDADSNSLRLRIALGDVVLLEKPLAFSFQGAAKSRLLAEFNGLAIPGTGILSFALESDSGQHLGSWDIAVEKTAIAPRGGRSAARPGSATAT
ncbi:MAG: hypothetical protein PSV22_08390, partial [Pseudolabrys sp.]|nr:hypothetical protein [Pseudolabrys sp.]